MKKFISQNHSSSASSLGFCALFLVAQPAQAAISWVIDTGGPNPGNTTFTNGGSWTGDGTVAAYTTPSTSGPLLSGTTGGSLVLNDLNNIPVGPNPPGFTTTHNIMIMGGGTADITARTSGGHANGFFVTPGPGVTGFMWETIYSDPLHSKRKTAGNNDPWLGSIGIESGPNVDVSTSISGIQTLTGPSVASGTSTPGFTGPIMGFVRQGAVGNPNLVISGNSLVSSAPRTLSGTQNLHVNRVTPDDPGNTHNAVYGGNNFTGGQLSDGILHDGERLLGDTIKWTVTPTAGRTFAANNVFLFTFDGAIGEDALELNDPEAIPEPTRTLLLGFGLIGLFWRRQRR